jgi:DNA invertase Pin-like site-specific DNA recombinase
MSTGAELIPVVGLVRQSRERDSKLSPDTQRGGIMTFAEKRGQYVVAWEEELDVPGDAFRPGLERAVRLVEDGSARGVVLWKVDRLGREPEGMYAARGRIERAGGRMYFADEDFDLDSEAGDYLFAMFAARAKAERRRIAANWKRATTAANQQHGIHQGDAYGYRRPTDAEIRAREARGERYPRSLVVEDAERGAPALAMRLRAEGKPWSTVCAALTAAGYVPRRAPCWNVNSVKNIVANRVYLGEARQGELVNPRAHEPLVSLDVFRAANANRGVGPTKRNTRLLVGLVRCWACRYGMRPFAGWQGRDSSAAYRCRKKYDGSRLCTHPARINAARLEAWVLDQAFTHHDVIMEAAHRELDVEALDAAVRDAEAELTEFITAMSASKFPQHFAAGLQQREAALEHAMLEREHKLATLAPDGVDMVFSLRQEWPRKSLQERREALSGLIDYIIIHPDDGAAIIWRGQSASLGPVPKQGSGQGKSASREITPFPWPLMEGEARVPLLEVTAKAVR